MLILEFALHPHAPAVKWARKAEEGDILEIGDPCGSTIAKKYVEKTIIGRLPEEYGVI